ncbi:MAG: DUF192 domain-containing protein [Candidatus Chisholmbacteria bacterium]|nr:DUF192 domain-containing protein [Candidatus Chisholmbacteria bacterium]
MEKQQVEIKFPAGVKRFIFFLILAIAVGMLVGWKIVADRLPASPAGGQTSVGLRVGEVVVKIEVADTPEEREKGLSGRESLGEDQGMLFVFEQPGEYGFWMKGMNFGLDFVWIKDSKVTDVTENVSVSSEEMPPVYQPQQPVEAMLEVNAGWVKRHQIEIGDEVVLE